MSADPSERLERLLSRLESLEQRWRPLFDSLEQLPSLLAMMGDIFDEVGQRARAQGVSLERSGRNLWEAALSLGNVLDAESLQRWVRLLEIVRRHPELPDFLERLVHASSAHSLAGSSSSPASDDSSRAAAPSRPPLPSNLGLFGLLRSLRDPHIQRTVRWALQAAQRFDGGQPSPSVPAPSTHRQN